MEAEQVDGRHRGDDDGEGGGEALEDVVGVLHHQGHQQPTERLVEDDAPYHAGVPKQEATLGNGGAIIPPQSQQAKHHAEDSQLHIPHPHGGGAALQDLLKVYAGKSRRQAADHHGNQAHGVVLSGGVLHRRLFVALLLHLQRDDQCVSVRAGLHVYGEHRP